ncbi:MAG: hypothetical protein EPO26_11950 [Chloroflexota bacterium]|nr:MAG: hypothetical protein EPO26_11950 [Chloroflexota bacterium]
MSDVVVGILPAAGLGRRIAGLRWRKHLYPVGWEEVDVGGALARRPRVVAAYALDAMVAAGADRLIVIIGEQAEVMHHFGGFRGGVPIAYLYQDEPRGGAFALDLSRSWLPDEHTILFGFPDTIVDPVDAYARLLARHRAAGADLTLGLFPTDRPSQFGMVELIGDRPLRVIDKPSRSNLRYLYGIAAWGPRVTSLLPELLVSAPIDREAVPGDLFQFAIDRGLVATSVSFDDGRYLDVGTPSSLNEALTRFGDTTVRP